MGPVIANILDSTEMSCSSKSLAHVVKFDGSNLPLWRLGLDVALEEHDVQSVTDGTCACPPEVNLFTLKVSSWTQSPLTKIFLPIETFSNSLLMST